MTSVNLRIPDDELHAPLLMGLLFRHVHDVFASEDWGGLRQSHFRVVAWVPPEGISVTELAERVGMTKQGVGQFVTHLVGTGHLSEGADPGDRRVRLVRRTRKGRALLAAVRDRNLRIEADWAEHVGESRYREFRTVLEEIALGRSPSE
jgi:DNA-binding MarR family transcriptional regulator